MFNVSPVEPLSNLDVLYAVGGLYGNELALKEVLRLFERERGRKQLVFNGDFHWFDADPTVFARIQRSVMQHTALRGNVETELAQDSSGVDAGCGCAYPEWVGDGVVQRSNRILQRLRGATTPAIRREMGGVAGIERRLGVVQSGVHMDAVAIAVNPTQAVQRFLAQWPQGTDAHVSYFSRIVAGPAYSADQVIRMEK